MTTPDHLEPRPRAVTAEAVRDVPLAHAAWACAQLLIARAIHASRSPPAAPIVRADTVQARFYTRLQNDLQEWIIQGGFSQFDTPDAPDAPSESDRTDVYID